MTAWLVLCAAGALAASAPRIELYTMGEGTPLFERFGHAALCVVPDDAPDRGRCYNYGTTHFDTPPQEIGYRFLRGQAIFWVSVWRRDVMLQAYERTDRSIWRQDLPLSADQARRVADRLAFDAREEHRTYRYHHFRDNCATRLRDVIDQSTDGALARAAGAPLGVSYRDLARAQLSDQVLLLPLSDLVLGRATDLPLSRYQGMFLPRLLREEVAQTLGAPPVAVYRRVAPLPAPGSPIMRYWGLLLALGAALPRRFHAAIGVLLGLLGVLVWTVAAVSAIPDLRVNEALLVFLPTDLAIGWISERWRNRYVRARLSGLLLVSLLLAVSVLRQPLLLLALGAAASLLPMTRVSATPARPAATGSSP